MSGGGGAAQGGGRGGAEHAPPPCLACWAPHRQRSTKRGGRGERERPVTHRKAGGQPPSGSAAARRRPWSGRERTRGVGSRAGVAPGGWEAEQRIGPVARGARQRGCGGRLEWSVGSDGGRAKGGNVCARGAGGLCFLSVCNVICMYVFFSQLQIRKKNRKDFVCTNGDGAINLCVWFESSMASFRALALMCSVGTRVLPY